MIFVGSVRAFTIYTKECILHCLSSFSTGLHNHIIFVSRVWGFAIYMKECISLHADGELPDTTDKDCGIVEACIKGSNKVRVTFLRVYGESPDTNDKFLKGWTRTKLMVGWKGSLLLR
jgi:hypothetical protein